MTDGFRYFSLINSNAEVIDRVVCFDKQDGYHVKLEKFKNGECYRITSKYINGISGKASVDSITMISEEEFELYKRQ